MVSTGREEGHDVHWLKEPPEQVAQSGWQVRQDPAEENVLDGQLATHLPDDASWLDAHVKQNDAEPAQVLHEESQAIMSLESIRVKTIK